MLLAFGRRIERCQACHRQQSRRPAATYCRSARSRSYACARNPKNCRAIAIVGLSNLRPKISSGG